MRKKNLTYEINKRNLKRLFTFVGIFKLIIKNTQMDKMFHDLKNLKLNK